MKTLRQLLSPALLACVLAGGPAALGRQQQQTSQTPAPPTQAARGPQEVVKEGIKVEFTVEPVEKAGALTAGRDAVVRFRVSDTATKTPLGGVRPAAWMTLREGAAADQAQCRERVQGFMQGSLRARPDVDLNTYYILTLNQEPNVSVIDPLLGFGGSKLVTLVLLRSPGADWALTSDRARLFVSMPAVNQVAVVDTATWKVVSNIDAGTRPTRVRLQPDEKYLWVGNDREGEGGQGGVTVIDAAALKVAATIPTGAGEHEVAFSDDNKFAYVTNSDAATLSVVDVARLAKVKDVKAGVHPVSVAYSGLSRVAYVASEGGQITAVGGPSHEPLATLSAKPGLKSVRFAPGGRYGFAPNAAESVVYVFDASTNRPLHSIAVGKGADQVAFTDNFAYVRSAGTEEVSAIRLSTIGKEPDVVKFPGGGVAPNAEPAYAAPSDAIVPAPEGGAVLVANPGDKQIYYYSEGMAAPMGNFQNYRRVPRAVRVVDRSLREESRGVYATNVKLPKGGKYDVAFLLDSPRIIHCFEAEATPDPSAREEKRASLHVEYLNGSRNIRVGEPFKLRFKLLDPKAGTPVDGLTDVRVLFFLAPGIWQQRDFAQPAGGGVYELTLTAPESGVYMVFVESPSRGVGFRQLPYLTLDAAATAEGNRQ
ncbi:MAG TPA: cytochrome D1 domain-containing protein [Pyrinomonadaceae bacterium]|nr:cytochrome D1 domain-containing protein [Pyrinomonadaceae bacterium]